MDRTYEHTYVLDVLDKPVKKKATFDESFHAPILGLAASVPISEKFGFYGNLAYGWINGDADGNYYLGELGLNYRIPIKKISSAIAVHAGYRFQRLELDFDTTTGDQSDTLSGFIFGVNVFF